VVASGLGAEEASKRGLHKRSRQRNRGGEGPSDQFLKKRETGPEREKRGGRADGRKLTGFSAIYGREMASIERREW